MRRFVAGALRVLSAPARLAAGTFDRLDEKAARDRREALGRRRWLVSWQKTPDGRWRARLSGPSTARTIERTAETRLRAIERAERVMGRLEILRASRAVRAARPTV